MGWLASIADKTATRQNRAELEAFIRALASMSDSEIAELMVYATRTRQLIERQGVNLLDPGGLHLSHPQLLPDVIALHSKMRAQGNIVAASALMVWGLTLKVAGRLELLPEGKRMWQQLSRGFSQIGEAALLSMAHSGEILDVQDGQQVPRGFG